MESKILIDVNYASKMPQIAIHHVEESEDPRDKLIAMLLGESMPGTSDGYCRIERYPGKKGNAWVSIITPIHPVDMINHIPTIAQFAEENAACDTSGVPAKLKQIIEQEHMRIKGLKPVVGVTDMEQLAKSLLKVEG